MRCWDVRLKVSDYLNGSVDAVTRRLLETHLEACPTCPPLYASLVGVKSAVGGLRDPNSVVPPAVAARVVQYARSHR